MNKRSRSGETSGGGPLPKVLVTVVGERTEPPARAPEISVTQVCTLLGYRARGYELRDLRDLRRMARFVPQVVRLPTFAACPLLIHIDADGDEDAMRAGPDSVTWGRFVGSVRALLRELSFRPEPNIVVLSVPDAADERLEALLRSPCRARLDGPVHAFLFARSARSHARAVFGWTRFYGEVADIDFSIGSIAESPHLQRLQRDLREQAFGTLRYFSAP